MVLERRGDEESQRWGCQENPRGLAEGGDSRAESWDKQASAGGVGDGEWVRGSGRGADRRTCINTHVLKSLDSVSAPPLGLSCRLFGTAGWPVQEEEPSKAGGAPWSRGALDAHTKGSPHHATWAQQREELKQQKRGWLSSKGESEAWLRSRPLGCGEGKVFERCSRDGTEMAPRGRVTDGPRGVRRREGLPLPPEGQTDTQGTE